MPARIAPGAAPDNPAPFGPPSAGETILAAHAAMQAGCHFVAERAEKAQAVADRPGRVAGDAPARMVGDAPGRMAGDTRLRHLEMRMAANCLQELDRFMTILVEACQQAGAGGPGNGGTAARPRRPGAETTVPDMLARMGREVGGGAFGGDLPRLRAIERVRQALCGDRPMRSAGRARYDLAIACQGHLGQDVRFAGMAALAGIARFYMTLADRLVRRFVAG